MPGMEQYNGDQEEFDTKANKKSWLDKIFPYKEDRRDAVKAGAGVATGLALGGAAYAAQKAGIIGETPQTPTAEQEAVEAQAGIKSAKTQEAAQEEMSAINQQEGAQEKKRLEDSLKLENN